LALSSPVDPAGSAFSFKKHVDVQNDLCKGFTTTGDRYKTEWETRATGVTWEKCLCGMRLVLPLKHPLNVLDVKHVTKAPGDVAVLVADNDDSDDSDDSDARARDDDDDDDDDNHRRFMTNH
jgi:hypothetical protein